jgi:methylated-DNA-[protein]-cysteine S-methyltransferase
MKNFFFYDYPVGKIGICEEGGFITRLFFCGEKRFGKYEIAKTPPIERAAAQLDEYFEGKRKVFDLPLAPLGTRFQLSVWQALREIPFGETRSYSQIADRVKNAKSRRAVGMANNRNPIAIIIPCHRVIGKKGGLVGYAGGLAVKEYLLALEKRFA